MMDIASGVSMVAGVGTILGTAAEHKKMSQMGQAAGYLTGTALILFSIYEHFTHKEKMRRKWHDHMKRMHRRRPRYPPADFRIVGGQDKDYNFEFNQQKMAMAQSASNHMWPRREPRGYLTGMGMEERGIPGSGAYEYPDSIYEYGRTRIAPSAYA